MTPGTLLLQLSTGIIFKVISCKDYFMAKGLDPRFWHHGTHSHLYFFFRNGNRVSYVLLDDAKNYQVLSTFKQQLKELL